MARSSKHNSISAVDLFCGAGGLTHGLIKAGIPVVAGFDVDPACKYPFEANNRAEFVLADVATLSPETLAKAFGDGEDRVLVGCAPCQPFSRYAQRVTRSEESKWSMLEHFARLVESVRPTIVSMENVPELERQAVFEAFAIRLKSAGYHVTSTKVFCPEYGIPQLRTRLVLLASMRGPLKLLPPTHKPHKYRTVKHAINALPALSPGEVDPNDSLHRASRLSELNLRRIRVSKPGGCWRDWPSELVADCHRSESGKTYPSVYGRMEWDAPAPTITTQFFGYGNGRFGHPSQDRAISLREGAILQSFPKSYKFIPPKSDASFAELGRLIGNAVPVRLGEIIGKSIVRHLEGSDGKAN